MRKRVFADDGGRITIAYFIQYSHWRFVRVKGRDIRLQIKEAAWGRQQIEDAAELIILCADTQAWSDRPHRYWANADAGTQAVLLPMLKSFYTDKKQTQRDEAMRSCGMAAQTLMLSAKAANVRGGQLSLNDVLMENTF